MSGLPASSAAPNSLPATGGGNHGGQPVSPLAPLALLAAMAIAAGRVLRLVSR
jgi:hypothetical protein